jgi:hypothetical protein
MGQRKEGGGERGAYSSSSLSYLLYARRRLVHLSTLSQMRELESPVALPVDEILSSDSDSGALDASSADHWQVCMPYTTLSHEDIDRIGRACGARLRGALIAAIKQEVVREWNHDADAIVLAQPAVLRTMEEQGRLRRRLERGSYTNEHHNALLLASCVEGVATVACLPPVLRVHFATGGAPLSV